MPIPVSLQPLFTSSLESRIEALRILLGYPLKLRDPQGSRFWYVRPGVDAEDAENTCPIAVGFYEELNTGSERELKSFLTDDQQQKEIYGHYTERTIPDRPVMYLLLPESSSGNAAMILPTEGRLRQRQIQIFTLSNEDFQARLNRLRQSELQNTKRLFEGGLATVPLVEWAFYKPIETAKELAQQLAKASREIEERIPEIYNKEDNQGYLHNLLLSFQRELLPTLKLKADNSKDYSFADIYAQTIAYGLFTARVFGYTVAERKQTSEPNQAIQETDFNRQDAWQLLPETNPFLRRLFHDVSLQTPEELGDELLDSISELISILRAAKMDAILADFRAKMNREDIIIHFYEDFLAAYKPKMREMRGVYYTPEPVVSYMVRSVDILLKEKFNKPLGIADPEVMILDPACGTGTFLLEIFKRIFDRFQESAEALTEGLQEKSWSAYVREHLLPRIFGFELLMAPYAIAHLKLGLYLEEKGYKFESGKRLGVYLTNTLDEAAQKSESLFKEFISEESDQAAVIKRDLKIMVVIGNPPYSGHSANNNPWIAKLLRDYYQIDGKALGERNPKWLQDDYVKFFRFAQWRINRSARGILAFVTNHSFIDNPTFRGMRYQLLQNFNSLYFYDLHGNIKKREKQSNGLPDENVFDIQQGVSITIGLKGSEDSTFHLSLYGSREEKYTELNTSDIKSSKWNPVQAISPSYFLTPQNTSLRTEYEKGFKLTELMPVNVLGFQSHRDHFAIDFEETVIRNRIKDLRNLHLEDKEIKRIYNLVDTESWQVENAREQMRKEDNWENTLIVCAYRPFDWRSCYFGTATMDRPRRELLTHVVNHTNLCINTVRQTKMDSWQHVLVSDSPTPAVFIEIKDGSNVFPLYLYPDANNLQNSLSESQIKANFSEKFIEFISSLLKYEPEAKLIFFYIYAILYSPKYRTRYAEFLKTDFPRIPFTSDITLFQKLAEYGEELVALHLMKSSKLDALITEFEEDEGHRILDPGHPKYNDGRVIINKKGDAFIGIPEQVWNFYIGGYQVCQKWLKDRKGRTLSDEDIRHYQRIIVALKETMVLMEKIDEAIPSFPIV